MSDENVAPSGMPSQPPAGSVVVVGGLVDEDELVLLELDVEVGVLEVVVDVDDVDVVLLEELDDVDVVVVAKTPSYSTKKAFVSWQ